VHTLKVVAGGVAEEAPVFLVVFAVPAAIAGVLAWMWSQG
jgi:hypothetical protein